MVGHHSVVDTSCLEGGSVALPLALRHKIQGLGRLETFNGSSSCVCFHTPLRGRPARAAFRSYISMLLTPYQPD
jgi:hypothetical protein